VTVASIAIRRLPASRLIVPSPKLGAIVEDTARLEQRQDEQQRARDRHGPYATMRSM
jgi:hypothetical protein